MADITGLAFPMLANTRYSFKFVIEFTTPANTTGARFGVNGPAAPTRLTYMARQTVSSSTEQARLNTAYDSTDLAATSASGGNNLVTMEGIINNGANAGDLIARFASEVSSSAVIAKAGSFVEYAVLA